MLYPSKKYQSTINKFTENIDIIQNLLEQTYQDLEVYEEKKKNLKNITLNLCFLKIV